MQIGLKLFLYIEERILLLINFGYEAIENIEVGDTVIYENEKTGEVAENEEIISTPKHKFYSPSKGWTSAEDLRAGGYTCTFKRRICNSWKSRTWNTWKSC